MTDSLLGPPLLVFKRNMDSVADHYSQAAGLLLNSTIPSGSIADSGDSAHTRPSNQPSNNPELERWRLHHRALQILLQQLRPAYSLPAELLNTYLDWAAVDQLWDRSQHDVLVPRRPDLLRRVTADAYIAGITLALKTGLDLLVPILACYFRGLPRHATWGEYRDQGRPVGWMAVVAQGKDRDPLLYRIDQAYRTWIVVALAPGRGHLDDDAGVLHWDYTDRERLLVAGRWATPEGCPAHRYAAGLQACLLNEWYRLVNDILMTLAVRPALPPRVGWELPSED